MTEFLGTDGGQIAGEVTGLTAAAEGPAALHPRTRRQLPAGSRRERAGPGR